jgi:c-di-GMP-binding flagellar brake protein YcgR
VEGEIIKDPAHVAQILRKIQDSHSLLTITVPGKNEPYQSAILEINPKKQYVVLDELTPARGHKRLLEIGELVARTKLKGIDVRFSTSLESYNVKDGIAAYRLKFPDEIVHMQKRQSFRISLGLGTNIPLLLKREDGTRLMGRVINISETGVGASIESDTVLELAEILPWCEIALSDDEVISSKLEIRFLKLDRESGVQKIGGRFLDMSGMQKRLLARKITDLQRDMMKRLPKDNL